MIFSKCFVTARTNIQQIGWPQLDETFLVAQWIAPCTSNPEVAGSNSAEDKHFEVFLTITQTVILFLLRTLNGAEFVSSKTDCLLENISGTESIFPKSKSTILSVSYDFFQLFRYSEEELSTEVLTTVR